MKKVRVATLIEKKQNKEKITSLTAYDYTFAYLMDEAGIDVILVGDSCGNVISGYDTTIPVTIDEIIYHTKSVKRGVKRAMIVADMPFMSYQCNFEDGIYNAGRLMKEGGAEAVKLEGGELVLPIVERLSKLGIPVLGHLGLTPQSVFSFSGYGVRGKKMSEAERIYNDAIALEKAGAFGIVLEKIPAELGKKISEKINIPTIGIGAGPFCDGQILVSYDMLGLYDKIKPKFVKRYREFGNELRNAVKEYCQEVKDRIYPSEEESY